MLNRYENFDLLITQQGESYSAHVIRSPVGQAKTAFTLPFTPGDLRRFAWLNARVYRHLRPSATNMVPSQPLTVQEFGRQLFETVFQGEVGQRLLSSLDLVQAQDAGLRLRLWLNEVPELADLPWEYLYLPSLARFAVQSDMTPLVRYLELGQAERTLTIKPPLHILALIANPHGVPPLQVEAEWQRLHEALDNMQGRQQVTLDRLTTATLPALQHRLGQGDVHILHFMGHGTFDPDTNTGGLVFEDESGQSRLVDADKLGTMPRYDWPF